MAGPNPKKRKFNEISADSKEEVKNDGGIIFKEENEKLKKAIA